ncbi:MAG: GTPase ObgE [Candidatus Saccharimonadales bacterium]
MFIDKTQILLRGGDGGKGVVSFRHEKFIDRGGPDGGDGGKGGDLVFIGSRNQNTLATFRYQNELVADSGKSGSKQKKNGRSGKDLRVMVPIGTVISREDGTEMADITGDGQEVIIAKGGKGGFGNAHFISSRRQSPRIAEKGEPGESYDAVMELKMIAEVGLIGLPNAGKSTLLSRITNAKPEIADYAFTTIRPNLGVADIDKNHSVLIADIPGLIEGASQGKGLGDEFLRHVERTKVLVHLIDAYQEDIAATYQIIRDELKAYKVDLSTKPEIIAMSKVDGLDDEIIADQMKSLKKVATKGAKIFAISSSSGKNIKELLYAVGDVVAKTVEQEAVIDDSLPVISLPDTDDAWQVTETDEGYVVTGQKIERFAMRTDFENEEGVDRLRDIMRKLGIMHEIERKGVELDNNIIFGVKPEHGRLKY